jgi:hypothetical protein
MTLDSVFRISSMTKAVTGTAAMQLVEEGRIGLDQPMGDVLPVIKNVKVLEGFDAGGAPRLRDPTFFTRAALVGAAMCSAYACGSRDRWP